VEAMAKPLRDMVALMVEEGNADAVVVAFSTVSKNKTRTYMGTFGNILACRGLVDELYSELIDPEDDEGGSDDDENADA